jgi:hypothetical protein
MTSLEIEPAALLLVAQLLKKLRYTVTPHMLVRIIFLVLVNGISLQNLSPPFRHTSQSVYAYAQDRNNNLYVKHTSLV